MKNLKLDAVEHHWCSTISTKLDLVPRGHLFPPPLSTSCKLSNNTSFAIRQMHNCRGCTCNQVFLVKNSQSLLTSKHIQHSSCPESGLHLCFPSTRLSRHTLQTSQWNDLSLWILFKTKNIKDSERLIDFLQLYVNETLTELLNLMFPNRPYFFSCREVLISNAIISNLHAHVPMTHPTQWSRI